MARDSGNVCSGGRPRSNHWRIVSPRVRPCATASRCKSSASGRGGVSSLSIVAPFIGGLHVLPRQPAHRGQPLLHKERGLVGQEVFGTDRGRQGAGAGGAEGARGGGVRGIGHRISPGGGRGAQW